MGKIRDQHSEIFVVVCFLLLISFACSQPLMCDILEEWIGVEKNLVLGIQTFGAVSFSALSMFFTKEFNFICKWIENHSGIKTIVGYVFGANYKAVWYGYGIILKLIFCIADSPEECNDIDALVEKELRDYNESPIGWKVTMSVMLMAWEGFAVTTTLGMSHYNVAVIVSHGLSFFASLFGVVVVISAIWEFIWKPECKNADIEEPTDDCGFK